MSHKLYTYPQNTRAYKILIAAKYAGLDIEVPNFTMGVDNKTKQFLDKFPMGQVPALETPEGGIWESNAILRYVARKSQKLYGSNAYENALVDTWLDWTSCTITPALSTWLYPIFGYMDNIPEATEKAKEDVKKLLTVLNNYLLTRTYLVGERITAADLSVAFALYTGYKVVFEPAFRKPFGNVTRWFTTCINQPEWKAVAGDFQMCEKMAVAPEKKKEEPKKEEPKKETKKEAEKDDAPEEDEFAEKKKKSKLDFLPPTKFNLEEWKRVYSNAKDTRKDAYPWLWQNFDAEGFCFYFAEYNYNDDLAKEPMFKNLNFVGGWIQRLDQLRKYGMGSIIIFGDDNARQIGSCWMFRGQEVPDEMKEADDHLLYTWRKADLNNAADKALIEDYFAWDGDLGGRKVNQAKIFK